MASPLTHTQLLMWTGQKLAGRRPAYNMAFSFGLEGALDRERFATSFEELVRRVDVLRTVIDEVDGEPRQRLLDRPPRELEQVDLSGRATPKPTPPLASMSGFARALGNGCRWTYATTTRPWFGFDPIGTLGT